MVIQHRHLLLRKHSQSFLLAELDVIQISVLTPNGRFSTCKFALNNLNPLLKCGTSMPRHEQCDSTAKSHAILPSEAIIAKNRSKIQLHTENAMYNRIINYRHIHASGGFYSCRGCSPQNMEATVAPKFTDLGVYLTSLSVT